MPSKHHPPAAVAGPPMLALEPSSTARSGRRKARVAAASSAQCTATMMVRKATNHMQLARLVSEPAEAPMIAKKTIMRHEPSWEAPGREDARGVGVRGGEGPTKWL